MIALISIATSVSDNIVLALEALSMLVADDEQNSLILVSQQGIQLLSRLVASPNAKVQHFALSCLNNITDFTPVVQEIAKLVLQPAQYPLRYPHKHKFLLDIAMNWNLIWLSCLYFSVPCKPSWQTLRFHWKFWK